MGTSRSHFGHQRFCWIRVWHSAWSWLKLMVAAESVAGNTRTGMFTRLILRKPFQVGLAAMGALSAGWRFPATRLHGFSMGVYACLLTGDEGDQEKFRPF